MPDHGGVVPAIVLAAGKSTRMGRNKLLIEIQGKALVRWVIDLLLEAGLSDVIVVTGHQAKQVGECTRLCGPEVRVVHNPQYEVGRATSIQAGLSALPDSAGGVLMMPGDVPLVQPALVRELVAGFKLHERITFPVHKGKKGHPVIFPATAFQLLRDLRRDETLHDYLLANPGATHLVETADPGCVRDFDSPEDLALFLQASHGSAPD